MKSHLLETGTSAGELPLPAGSLGLSRRWDFWVMMLIGAAVFAALLYVGTRSAKGA